MRMVSRGECARHFVQLEVGTIAKSTSVSLDPTSYICVSRRTRHTAQLISFHVCKYSYFRTHFRGRPLEKRSARGQPGANTVFSSELPGGLRGRSGRVKSPWRKRTQRTLRRTMASPAAASAACLTARATPPHSPPVSQARRAGTIEDLHSVAGGRSASWQNAARRKCARTAKWPRPGQMWTVYTYVCMPQAHS
jgi:hypothetical protein